jgi:single-strand DNA-binding protein
MNPTNKTIAIGRIGRDPEMRYTPAGKAVVNTTIAADESYNKDGERIEKTKWYKVTAWGKVAEIINQHVVKGQFMVFWGSVNASAYLPEGSTEPRASLELTVDEFVFGPKPGGAVAAAPGAVAQPALGAEDIPF